MSLEDAYERHPHRDRLSALRSNPRQRRLVVAAGVLLGLGLGSLHWFGLVIGGAVVALPARTVPRGLGLGLALGVVELLVFGGLLTWQGALGPALSTGIVGGITVVIGFAAPIVGSLVRGIV